MQLQVVLFVILLEFATCAAFLVPAAPARTLQAQYHLHRHTSSSVARSFSPSIRKDARRLLTTISSTAQNTGSGDSQQIDALKRRLVAAIKVFKEVQGRDGSVSVDFGVKGGELDGDTRAPRNLASSGSYYSVSQDLGNAADSVLGLIQDLKEANPTPVPTQHFKTAAGESCPLHGRWSLLFTTAADASFSANSTRGDAQASNEVDAVSGKITNVIAFAEKADGALPAVRELRVQLAAEAVSHTSIEFRFKFVKVLLNSLFGLPIFRWFGRPLPIIIPVPGTTLTNILLFFRRLLGQKRQDPPKPKFEVLFLDSQMRIHRTGEGNIFVQGRPEWRADVMA